MLTKPDQQTLLNRSQEVLGWPELLHALSQRAVSDTAQTRCLSLPLLTNPEAVRLLLHEVYEVMTLINQGAALPLSPFDDVHAYIESARMGGVLSIEALEAIARQVNVAASVFRFFKSRERSEGRVADKARRIDPLSYLQRELEHCLDFQGGINEDATDALAGLRARQRVLHERILRRLESIIQSADLPLQDRFYTQRGSRYVIPVRQDAHSRVKGIVHDSSSSGATVFIEPEELVEPNNELRLIQSEIEKEIDRILRGLSRVVAEYAVSIEINQRVLIELDLLSARARLAAEMNANVPEIMEAPAMKVKKARHPLLVLAGQNAVPNDVILGHPVRVLLISGPNTGGKTVYLKMVGLLALMVRAGIPIPADPDSAMSVYPEVYADIGDPQDISKDLSTYSGHLLSIIGILTAAGPDSLVLLDELVSSTDPTEGAALAGSILAGLGEKVASTVATTHFGPLKVFAQHQEGFMNASFDFDLKNWTPTYQLFIGSPGRSMGIQIAEQMGLPGKVVAQARGMLDSSELKVDELLAELESQRRELLSELSEAREDRQKLRAMVDDYRSRISTLEARENELKQTIRSRVKEEIKRARAELNLIMNEIKTTGTKTVQKARETKTYIDRVEQELNQRVPEPEKEPEGEVPDFRTLKEGDAVKVMPFNKEAVLLSTPGEIGPQEQVRVSMGGMKITVTAASLRVPPGGPRKKQKQQPRVSYKPLDIPLPSELPQSPANTLDLRGMRAHEAEAELERYLDEAALAHKPNVFIIHGHGTGVIKQLVREYLAGSPYVNSYRPGVQGEGGDGVTVVSLNQLG